MCALKVCCVCSKVRKDSVSVLIVSYKRVKGPKLTLRIEVLAIQVKVSVFVKQVTCILNYNINCFLWNTNPVLIFKSAPITGGFVV